MATRANEDSISMMLEAVPPVLSRGEAGIEEVVDKVRAVSSAVTLSGVNIPEIREESSKSDRGERRAPFEPRVEPRRLALVLRDRLGLECMINRVVVHLEADRQADWFRETWEDFGVRQFVLVGGERSDLPYPGPSVPEANALIRRAIPDPRLKVGNICIPTRAGEARRMRRKMDAGTDLFTTQIIYHAEEFTRLMDDLAAEPGRPEGSPQIFVTVCPVRGARNIRFLHWLGVSLSPALEASLTAQPDSVMERSVAHIIDTWGRIRAHLVATANPFPVGVSIAPIGRIPPETTVGLARRLG